MIEPNMLPISKGYTLDRMSRVDGHVSLLNYYYYNDPCVNNSGSGT